MKRGSLNISVEMQSRPSAMFYIPCYKSGGGCTLGTKPYTGGAPPMLWTSPPLVYNYGLDNCHYIDRKSVV
jgi:hypothetical protein